MYRRKTTQRHESTLQTKGIEAVRRTAICPRREQTRTERNSADTLHRFHRTQLHTCDILEALRLTMKQKPFLWVSTSSSAASRTYHTARTLNVLSKLLSACPVSTSTTCNGRSDTYFDTRVQPRWGVSLFLSLSLSQPNKDKKQCSTDNRKSLAGVVRRVTNSSTTRNRIVRVTGNRVPLVCFLARSKRKIFGEHHCFGTTALLQCPYMCVFDMCDTFPARWVGGLLCC